MSYTFDESKDVVAARVKLFRTNFPHYHAPTYKEASARIDFIDSLFIALGWDVHNAQHLILISSLSRGQANIY